MSDEFTSAEFYRLLSEHRLMASRCKGCGAVYLPPRPICPACHGEEMEWAEMRGAGKLLAYTVIYIAPSAMLAAGYGRENPYCTGIVQVDEGPAISAQILGVDPRQPEQIAIGTPLHVEFVDRGEGKERRTYLAFTQD